MKVIAWAVLIQIFLIIAIIELFYNEREETEEQEEEERFYLKLMNTTSKEILLFKNKNEFIKSIKDYDTIKYFLKGTEEENTDKLLHWYYPGYKKM